MKNWSREIQQQRERLEVIKGNVRMKPDTSLIFYCYDNETKKIKSQSGQTLERMRF